LQGFAQVGAGAPQQGLDRLGRQAHGPRDGIVTLPLEMVELNHQPLPPFQPLHGPPDDGGQFLALDALRRWVGRCRNEFLQRARPRWVGPDAVQVYQELAAPGAIGSSSQVSGDGEEPGGEFRPRLIVLARPKDPEEDFLNQVLGVGPASDQALQVAQQPGPAALYQLVEGLRLVSSDAQHDINLRVPQDSWIDPSAACLPECVLHSSISRTTW